MAASSADLREEIIRLGPWHLDIQVTPEISTSVFLEAPDGTYDESFGPVSFQSAIETTYKRRMGMLYPGGLAGRSVLDCACNCGAYLFWAKDVGAGRCFGSDAREHWIEQARFLHQNREGPNDGMRFEVCDLVELPRLGLEPFDISIFTGVFYHLANPVTGLKIVADLTRELLLFDTATKWGEPDPALVLAEESTEQLMLGVHGLAWLPTGPVVVERILQWAGFVETLVVRWVEGDRGSWGRLGMLASKRVGLLDALRESAG
jgi:tRNA (mo5U34)-methyltransferase